MSKIAKNVRIVFDEFRRAFEEKHGATNWTLSFDSEDLERLGLSPEEGTGALDILSRKDLISKLTMAGYQLTPDGIDCCLDEGRLDDYLPRPG
jgi:hypothetical protein